MVRPIRRHSRRPQRHANLFTKKEGYTLTPPTKSKVSSSKAPTPERHYPENGKWNTSTLAATTTRSGDPLRTFIDTTPKSSVPWASRMKRTTRSCALTIRNHYSYSEVVTLPIRFSSTN